MTYTYDVANRLIAAGAQTYVWDAAGNLITDGAITYTYDSAQRLIGLESPGSTSSYVYNGLGDRVQQSVNGATTNNALDLNTGLTQVLADNGTVYLYGADRLGERQAGGWQYHHADGLGSLRALTNGSATVTLSKRYAPYGDVLDMAGTDASIFGYTGEQQNEGLVYLRARYYASGLGRFVSRDTWQGEYNRGLSLNRWTYVEANPIRYGDPRGHSICELLPPEDRPVECGGLTGPLVIFSSAGGFTDSQDRNRVAPELSAAAKNSIRRAAFDVGRAIARDLNAYRARLVLEGRTDTCLRRFPRIRPIRDAEAFLAVYGGPVEFQTQSRNANEFDDDAENNEAWGVWAQSISTRMIYLYAPNPDDPNRNINWRVTTYPRWIVHELGHSFENATEWNSVKPGRAAVSARPEFLVRATTNPEFPNAGFFGGSNQWQFSPQITEGEIFADMFTGWVYNKWEVNRSGDGLTELGSSRADFMAGNMTGWILQAIRNQVRRGNIR